MKETQTIDKEAHDELIGLIEDSVSQICDDYKISAKVAWTVLSALSEAKVMEIESWEPRINN
jgi:hypothetical protein